LFQEQVMEIAMVAAGFSAGEADKVRRSMAAWQRKGGLAEYRDKLLAGVVERRYSPRIAGQIYHPGRRVWCSRIPVSASRSFVHSSPCLRGTGHAEVVAGLLNSWPMGF